MTKIKAIVLAMGLILLAGASFSAWADSGPDPQLNEPTVYYPKGKYTAAYTDFDSSGVPQAYSIFVEINWKKIGSGTRKEINKQFIFTHKRASQQWKLCQYRDEDLLGEYGKDKDNQFDEVLKQLGLDKAKWEIRLIEVTQDSSKTQNCDDIQGAKVEGTFILELKKK